MSDECSGTVAFFDVERNFGFIVPDGTSPNERDRHLFVHGNAVSRSGLSTLAKGQRVAFRVSEPRRPGMKNEAQGLRLLDEAA
jgi:cold shock protein